MTKVRLHPIKKPAEGTRSIFMKPDLADDEPFLLGEGDVDLLCGSCDLVLARSLDAGQVTNLVFQCPRCTRYSETRT